MRRMKQGCREIEEKTHKRTQTTKKTDKERNRTEKVKTGRRKKGEKIDRRVDGAGIFCLKKRIELSWQFL